MIFLGLRMFSTHVFNTCFHVSFQVRNRLDDWTTEGPTTTSPRRPLGGMPPGEKECAEICGMHLEEARPLRDAMKIAFIYDTCITQTYIYTVQHIYIDTNSRNGLTLRMGSNLWPLEEEHQSFCIWMNLGKFCNRTWGV